MLDHNSFVILFLQNLFRWSAGPLSHENYMRWYDWLALMRTYDWPAKACCKNSNSRTNTAQKQHKYKYKLKYKWEMMIGQLKKKLVANIKTVLHRKYKRMFNTVLTRCVTEMQMSHKVSFGGWTSARNPNTNINTAQIQIKATIILAHLKNWNQKAAAHSFQKMYDMVSVRIQSGNLKVWPLGEVMEMPTHIRTKYK